MLHAFPGLALALLIAALARVLGESMGVAGASPLLIAIVLGMMFRACVGAPTIVASGLTFAVSYGLRLGVALLGLQLTIGQLLAGGRGVVIAATVLLITLLFTRWLGRRMGVEDRLTALIAAGTSICGASAIIGANSIACAEKEDVSYAIAAVTVMGLILMIVYPPISLWLSLSSADYGIWVGSSVHEVAQVVAAGFERGADAGQVATTVKLTRVLLLAPVLMFVARLERSGDSARAGPSFSIPWFVTAFLVMVALNSAQIIPAAARSVLVAATPWILTIGLAAVGMATDARAVVRRGLQPLLLAFFATTFIAVLSLVLVEVSAV